eukprot:5201738-Pyramimonas_sp.AAC.1
MPGECAAASSATDRPSWGIKRGEAAASFDAPDRGGIQDAKGVTSFKDDKSGKDGKGSAPQAEKRGRRRRAEAESHRGGRRRGEAPTTTM